MSHFAHIWNGEMEVPFGCVVDHPSPSLSTGPSKVGTVQRAEAQEDLVIMFGGLLRPGL